MGQGVSSEDYQDNIDNAWLLEPGDRKRNGLRDDKTGQRRQFIDDQIVDTLTRRQGNVLAHSADSGELRTGMGVLNSPRSRQRRNSMEAHDLLTNASIRGSLRHYGNLLSDSSHANFPLQYITSVAVSERISQLTPQKSVAKVTEILNSGNFITRKAILSVSDNQVTIIDGSTRHALNTYPLNVISMVQVVPGKKGHTKLFIFYTEEGVEKRTKLHIFQSDQTPVETVAAKLGYAIHQYSQISSQRQKPKRKKNDQPQVVGDNWILGRRSPESPLQHSRQSPTSVSMETHDGPHGAVNQGQSPALHRRGQPTRRIGQVSRPTDDVRLTIKASKIQRDVDVLNHTLEDLDDFLKEVRGCAQAFKEYETRRKRAKKDAALDELKERAKPPEEMAFITAYQKCKFAINLTAKLGHHLSSPPASKMIKSILGVMDELIGCNGGPKLASSVVSPLISKRAIELAGRVLGHRHKFLWNDLGPNWNVTYDKWPKSKPIPDFHIIFNDQCTPTQLHNLSDRPANFPTLNPLPPELQGLDYSDAYDDSYDGDLDECMPARKKEMSINPAVKAAISSHAAMVQSGPIPKTLQTTKSEVDTGLKQNVPSFVVMERTDSGEISSGPGSVAGSVPGGVSGVSQHKMVPVLMAFKATSQGDLSVSRGETVEVVDRSKYPRILVRNRLGKMGYVDNSLLGSLEQRRTPSPHLQHTHPKEDPQMLYHGQMVPPPPNMPPPPPPPDDDDLVASFPSPTLSSQMRWRSAQTMGLPMATNLPHPLDDIPDELRSSANQLLPPIPPPVSTYGVLPEPRPPVGNRYRKETGPPIAGNNVYKQTTPPSAPPTTLQPTYSTPVSPPFQPDRPTTPPLTQPVVQGDPMAPLVPPFHPQPPGPPPSGGPAPPPPPPSGGPAPPPPPPPPPVPGGVAPAKIVLPKPKSLEERLAEAKLKKPQDEPEERKRKVSGMPDQPMDIVEALSRRKPLRKVTVDHDGDGARNEFQSELQKKLKKRKDSNAIMEEEEGEDEGPQIGPLLPFDANEERTQKWLNTYGYQSCAAKLLDCSAKDLYLMTKDDLKEVIGLGSSARLYSQLQRDRAKAESMVSREFRNMLTKQKTRAEMVQDAVTKWKKTVKAPAQNIGNNMAVNRGRRLDNIEEEYNTRRRGRGNDYRRHDSADELEQKRDRRRDGQRRRRYDSDDDRTLRRGRHGSNESDDGYKKQKRNRNKGDEKRRGRHDRGRDSGDERRRGRHDRDRDSGDERRRGRHDRDRDSGDERRHGRHDRDRDNGDERRRGRHDRDRDSGDERRRGRKGKHRDRDSDDERRRGRRDRSRDSDDEVRHGQKGKRKDKRKHKYDSEEDETRKRRPSKEGRRGRHREDSEEDRRRQRHRRGSSSYSDSSYSESESDSSYSSESENDKVKEVPGGQWALGEGDTMVLLGDPEEQIKQQQAQLQKHMAQLQLIQKQMKIKSLPPEQQKSLQKDLLDMQQIQMERQKKPNDTQVQLQLIKQQQVLQEHLIELQQQLVMTAITSSSDTDGPRKTEPTARTTPISRTTPVRRTTPIISPTPSPIPVKEVDSEPDTLIPVVPKTLPSLPHSTAQSVLTALPSLTSLPSATIRRPTPTLLGNTHTDHHKDAELAALKAQIQAQQAAHNELVAHNQQQAHIIAQQQDQLQLTAQQQVELLNKSQLQEYLIAQQAAQVESWSSQKSQLEQMLAKQRQESEVLQQQLTSTQQQQQQLLLLQQQQQQQEQQQQQKEQQQQQQLLLLQQQQEQQQQALQQSLNESQMASQLQYLQQQQQEQTLQHSLSGSQMAPQLHFMQQPPPPQQQQLEPQQQQQLQSQQNRPFNTEYNPQYFIDPHYQPQQGNPQQYQSSPQYIPPPHGYQQQHVYQPQGPTAPPLQY